MEHEFIMLDISSGEREVDIPKRIKILPKVFRENYIFKKLPVKKEEIQIMGAKGIKYVLPYTREDILNLYDDTIMLVLKRVIMRENIRNAIADFCLEPYLDSDVRIDGKCIPYLICDKMLLELANKKEIELKEAKLCVIDSNDTITNFIISQVSSMVNYCTIITERPDEFQTLSDHIFDETGLMLDVITPDNLEPIQADIIFDLSYDTNSFRFYPKGSIIFDFTGNLDKSRKVIVKKKDTIIYNTVDVMTKGVVMEHKILQAIICKDTFEECKYRMDECYFQAKDFYLQIKNLKNKVYS